MEKISVLCIADTVGTKHQYEIVAPQFIGTNKKAEQIWQHFYQEVLLQIC